MATNETITALNDAALKLKEAFITTLQRNPQKMNEPFMYVCNEVFTRKQMVDEITNNTEQGLQMMVSLMILGAEMIKRDKSK